MSIEAILRGKCEDTKEWVYGYYTLYGRSRGVHHAIITGTDKVCVIPKFIDRKTRGMFTGLADMNDKMTYEGDIIRHYNSVPMKISMKLELSIGVLMNVHSDAQEGL